MHGAPVKQIQCSQCNTTILRPCIQVSLTIKPLEEMDNAMSSCGHQQNPPVWPRDLVGNDNLPKMWG